VSTSGPGDDTREMVLTRRVIRREFGQLPRLSRSAEQATPGQTLGSWLMPRLFLFGGSGRTGGHNIDHALSKGHTLAALVRDPAKLTRRAGLTAVQGTPVNRSDVDGAIDGADAVIVALNSTRRSDTPWAKPVSRDPQHGHGLDAPQTGRL